MNIIDFFNERIKSLNLWDFKLAQLAALLFMWIVVKIFPSLLGVSFYWLVIPLVLVAFRLFYVIFLKKSK